MSHFIIFNSSSRYMFFFINHLIILQKLLWRNNYITPWIQWKEHFVFTFVMILLNVRATCQVKLQFPHQVISYILMESAPKYETISSLRKNFMTEERWAWNCGTSSILWLWHASTSTWDLASWIWELFISLHYTCVSTKTKEMYACL